MKPNYLALGLTAVLVLVSPNPILMAYSGLSIFLIIKFMWRNNEPKFLFFNMIIYWLTVSVLLPYGAIFNKQIADLSDGANSTITFACFLALTAMIVFNFGIRQAIRKLQFPDSERLARILFRYDAKKLFVAYIIYASIATFFGKIFLSFAGGQMLMSFIFFKWVLLTFLIIHTLLYPSNSKYVITLIVFEILLSFSGFWSDFKDYLIVAIAAFFTVSRKISFKATISTILVGIFLFIVSVVWSFSKGKYRMYLTGGERSQLVVKTDALENIQMLLDIVSNDFSSENFSQNFSKGSEGLLYRVSYIEYLGRALKQVPTFIPHEDGALLLGAFEHIFKPRILFPEKKTLDDSEITSKYTGTQFAGREEGASFAFGVVPERYVDFGPVYMFIPIFFFGLYVGYLYKTLIAKGYNLVWGLCYSAPFFNFMVAYGLPTTKFLGWSITYVFGLYFINRYLVRYLDEWLLKKEFKQL